METTTNLSCMLNPILIFVRWVTIYYSSFLYYFIWLHSWDVFIFGLTLRIWYVPPTNISILHTHLWIKFWHRIWTIICEILIPKRCGWYVYMPSLIFWVIFVHWKVIFVNRGLQLSLRNLIIWHIYCMRFEKPNNIFEVLLLFIHI